MTFILIKGDKLDKFVNVKEIKVIYFLKEKNIIHIFTTDRKVYECKPEDVIIVRDDDLTVHFVPIRKGDKNDQDKTN